MALLVPDDLWAVVEPLLPPERPKPKGGRPRASDRAALAGILFVLRTGIQWHELPLELGCCGKTCWRRLGEWHAVGVWAGLHRVLLERLNDAGALDWHRAALDSASLRSKRGVPRSGPTRRIAASRARSVHLVTDVRGTPLGVALSGANRHDSLMLVPTLDAVPGVRARHRGRPRHRPDKLHADKGYDHHRCRRECRARGIKPYIARRGVESSQKLGRHRWVVERTFAWLNQFRRLTVRYERRADLHLALTTLACAVICLRQIRRFVPDF